MPKHQWAHGGGDRPRLEYPLALPGSHQPGADQLRPDDHGPLTQPTLLAGGLQVTIQPGVERFFRGVIPAQHIRLDSEEISPPGVASQRMDFIEM